MAKDKKVGRPPIIDNVKLQKLREGFLMGYNDEEACEYADLKPSTFYDFQKKNREFSECKQQWKLNPVLKAKKTVFDNLDKIGVAQWYLEKKCSDEFAAKQKQEITGNIDGINPITINVIPVEPKNEI